MTAATFERADTHKLVSMRNEFLERAGKSREELEDLEARGELSIDQYVVLDRLRQIDFMLDD